MSKDLVDETTGRSRRLVVLRLRLLNRGAAQKHSKTIPVGKPLGLKSMRPHRSNRCIKGWLLITQQPEKK